MAEEKAQVERVDRVEEELRTLFGQAESLRQQIATIDATILDLATVLETIDYIKEKGKDKTVLVPIGAGNFIRAKIVDTEHVIMGVGGRLSVEATIDEAKAMINERIRALEQLRLDLRRKLEEINARISELVAELQKQAGEEAQG
ncbi:MAG: prefoldin subunit alpha [Desulfurococcales archaeon]|nr:prefoldin subunit alpha [Desulfurococcales archaeon]